MSPQDLRTNAPDREDSPKIKTEKSARLSFGIDRILGGDTSSDSERTSSECESDDGRTCEEETPLRYGGYSPDCVDDRDSGNPRVFLPRFGLEPVRPTAIVPHPGVIRVPTHRPQPVLPMWPSGYGLPWVDIRRDRFGCEYSEGPLTWNISCFIHALMGDW